MDSRFSKKKLAVPLGIIPFPIVFLLSFDFMHPFLLNADELRVTQFILVTVFINVIMF